MMRSLFKRNHVIGPSSLPPIQIGPSRLVRIQPPRRGAWEERGWQRHHRNATVVYLGAFLAREDHLGPRHEYPGRIEVERSRISVFVQNPPPGIRNHPKSACFSYILDGWYQLHWYRTPKNVDDALLYVERILVESLNQEMNHEV